MSLLWSSGEWPGKPLTCNNTPHRGTAQDKDGADQPPRRHHQQRPGGHQHHQVTRSPSSPRQVAAEPLAGHQAAGTGQHQPHRAAAARRLGAPRAEDVRPPDAKAPRTPLLHPAGSDRGHLEPRGPLDARKASRGPPGAKGAAAGTGLDTWATTHPYRGTGQQVRTPSSHLLRQASSDQQPTTTTTSSLVKEPSARMIHDMSSEVNTRGQSPRPGHHKDEQIDHIAQHKIDINKTNQ
jgi:hypothetical protein